VGAVAEPVGHVGAVAVGVVGVVRGSTARVSDAGYVAGMCGVAVSELDDGVLVAGV
jgi:hypothetical protein